VEFWSWIFSWKNWDHWHFWGNLKNNFISGHLLQLIKVWLLDLFSNSLIGICFEPFLGPGFTSSEVVKCINLLNVFCRDNLISVCLVCSTVYVSPLDEEFSWDKIRGFITFLPRKIEECTTKLVRLFNLTIYINIKCQISDCFCN